MHEPLDLAGRQHEVAYRDQGGPVEHRMLARGDQQDPALIGEALQRQRAGVRAQLGQLGREPEARAHFVGVGRGPEFADRGAARLGGGMSRHQGEHLVELQRFQIAFTHHE